MPEQQKPQETLAAAAFEPRQEVVAETLRRVTSRIKGMRKRDRLAETVTNRILARIKNGE